MRAWVVGVLVLLVAACGAAPAPAVGSLDGPWHGTIDTPGSPLEFGITFDGDGGALDLPAQGLVAVPVREVVVQGRSVRFVLPDLPGGAAFEGTIAGSTITGSYTQGAQTTPFTLVRGPLEPPARPQEPQPPFPYTSEEVTIDSGPLTLAGTLTWPEGPGPFAAVLMITGSGPQDRDETISGHRPFLLLADTLTRAGYAVLRVDDRGVGGSGGDLDLATYDDLGADALAAIAYLAGRADVDPARIGLFGHSEGGYLAPLVAQRAPPGTVAFTILMAAPAVPGDDVLVLQNRLIFEGMGFGPEQVDDQVAFITEFAALLVAGDLDGARALARARITEQTASLPEDLRPTPEQIEETLPVSPNLRAFVAYDPAPALAALRVPVLAVYGDRDLQVPPAQSEPALRAALAGNPDTTIQTFAGLNHLMQPAATGALAEYETIETTIDPAVLDLVAAWLRERF